MARKKIKHPVTEYAEHVVNGKIPAGKLTALACERHLRDLKAAPMRGLFFDEEAADHAIVFFGFLKLWEGEWAGCVFEPQPWQKFIVGSLFGWKRADGLRRFRVGYIEVPRKNGKALALDTPLPTPTGWTTMGRVQVGDVLFDENGTSCKVLAVTEVIYGRPCYELTFSDGSKIVADESHEWRTSARVDIPGRRSRKGTKHGETVITRARTTKEIRETLVCGQRGDRNHSIPIAKPLQILEKELPIPPYILGAWLGDGNSDDARITCGYGDLQIIEEIRRCGVEVVETPSSNAGSGRFRLGNGDRGGSARRNSWQAKLRKLGVLGNKHIPQEYLRASHQQRLELLRGLMDTDGYADKAGNCEFTTTSGALAEGMGELLSTLGLKYVCRECRSTLNGKDCGVKYRIQFVTYRDEPVFRLQRKAERLRPKPEKDTRTKTRQVVSVEPVPSVPVRCIQVASPSSLYLAGRSMVPTHNSPLMAGIGLYLLIADNESGAQIYSAATKRDQARIVWKHAAKMAKASLSISKRVRIYWGKGNMHVLETESKFEPLGADADTMDGLNIHGALIDELHAHKKRDVWDVLETATGARRQPLQLAITTAGTDQASICYEQHEYGEKILRAVIEDDTYFAYISCMDEGDDWTSIETWRKANPNFGISVKEDDLRRKCDKAKKMPAAQNAFLRLHLDKWTQQANRWISLELWDENAGIVVEEELKGRTCYGGLDLSSVSDLTAWVLVFPRTDDPETVDVLCRFWCPEARLHDDSNKYKDQYEKWKKSGHLTTTPGNAADYGFIRAQIIKDAETFQLKDLSVDRLFQAHQISMELQEEGIKIAGMGQGFLSMAVPMKEFERRLLAKKIRHGGNPVLRFMADNVAVREDPAGNLKPDKAASQGKIDGIVGIIMALDRAMRHEDKTSVYEKRGISSI